MALIGQARLPSHGVACGLNPRGQIVKRLGGGGLPAHEGQPLGPTREDEPLLAVVHSKQPLAPAAIDLLHAQKATCKVGPFLGPFRGHTDIAQSG